MHGLRRWFGRTRKKIHFGREKRVRELHELFRACAEREDLQHGRIIEPSAPWTVIAGRKSGYAVAKNQFGGIVMMELNGEDKKHLLASSPRTGWRLYVVSEIEGEKPKTSVNRVKEMYRVLKRRELLGVVNSSIARETKREDGRVFRGPRLKAIE